MRVPVELSVVIPAYREGKSLLHAIPHVRQCVLACTNSLEVLIVDDGSDDDTWLHIQELAATFADVRGIRFSRNYGKDAALAAGLNECDGEAAIILDADLQHPPELIPVFYNAWKRDAYQIVEAVKRARDDEPAMRRMWSYLFNQIATRVTSLDLRNSTDCKLLTRPVIEAWKRMGEYRLFFRGTVEWLGYKKLAIPFDVAPSLRPASNWSTLKLLRLASYSIISYSSVPLRVAHFISALFLLFSAVLGAETLLLKITGQAVDGFTTVIILILLVGGLQLGVLAVISEYLAAIYEEVKRRPRYVIAETVAGRRSEETERVAVNSVSSC